MGESQFEGETGQSAIKPTASARVAGGLRSFVRALREWPGWFIAAAGVVLCVIGWYGVSGERFAARQLPYLASATVPGAALIVAGAVLVTARPSGRGGGNDLTDRRVERLYALLVEPAEEPRTAVEAPSEEQRRARRDCWPCRKGRSTTAEAARWRPARTGPRPSTPTG